MRKKKDKWSLYIHKNKENGKVYVGITKWNPEKRWGYEGHHYSKQTKFWRAIQKYGWDGFEHIVVMNNLDKEEALLLEQQYIAMYDNYNNGYNATFGGEGGCGNSHSEETKEKIRQANKGRIFSDEHNKRLSESKKSKRPVICLETNKIYKNPRECAEDLHTTPERVLQVCRGDSFTTKGKHLLYCDEPLKTIDEIEIKRQKHPNMKPVVCLDTGEWFESANACGRYFGISGRNIRSAIKSKTRCGGRYFRFADEDYTIQDIIDRHNKAVSNQVRCIETGEVFSTVKECAEHYELDISNISTMCNGKGTAKHLKGLTFEYVDYIPRKKKVICKDSGEVFDSMKDCARKMGINYTTLNTMMRRNGKYEKKNIYFYDGESA